MNTNMIEKNWSEIKAKIKSKWGKFNDEELEGVKSDLSLLAGKIETAYGIGKDHADRQFDDFKKSVQALIGQEPSKPSLVIAPLAQPQPAPQAATKPDADNKVSQAV